MNAPRATEIRGEEEVAATRRANPYLAFATRAAIGVAVVAVLLWHYDARPVLRILARERLVFFFASIAIYVAGQVMSSWRWQLLAGVVGIRGRFREFLAYYFVGLFTNLFVPGLLGGDAARAIYLGRKSGMLPEAVASVVADRGTGLIALLWVAAATALAIPSALNPGVIRVTIGAGAAALVVFAASPMLARWIPYMPRPLGRTMAVAYPYLRRPQTMVPALALSAILQISLGFCQWLIARGLGMTAPLPLFLLCVPIANVAAGFPVTLNGLGVRETAYLVLFGMAGINRDDAIALGLLWFAATMLGGLTGAIAFAVTEFPKPTEAQGR
jgi:uncharacterized membrane protein YbhN (UPF0104 family)